MASRFLDKEYGATLTTAIADDATGRSKVRNLPDAAGIAYDIVSNNIKYNANGTIVVLQSGVELSFTPTAAVTLTALQSGTNVFLNAAAGFAITLPAPAAGLNYRFITGALFATTNFTIVTSGGANILFGGASVNSVFVPSSAQDTINFVATAETIGDYVHLVSDGTNWAVDGQGALAGSITFTAT